MVPEAGSLEPTRRNGSWRVAMKRRESGGVIWHAEGGTIMGERSGV